MYYAASRHLCAAQREQSFGIAVIEAMSAGCAIVTTQEVASGSLVEEARAGVILSAASPASVANALNELAANAAEARAAGERGKGLYRVL